MVSAANYKKLTKLPVLDGVRLQSGEEWSDVKKHSRVYIIPRGPTQDYIKAKVLEIRGGTEPPYWFNVQFYSGAEENPSLSLSATELILTPSIEWISSNVVQDVMGNFFKQFDDSIRNPPRINGKTWFHRIKKVPCTVCMAPYIPHLDRQRYCEACECWFHTKCLIAVGNAPEQSKDFEVQDMYGMDVHGLGDDKLPAIYNQILECPTLRGHDGEFDLENTWLTTGSGTQKALIQKWKVDRRYPKEWQVLFGERFLLDILGGKKWKWYLCAKCAKHI